MDSLTKSASTDLAFTYYGIIQKEFYPLWKDLSKLAGEREKVLYTVIDTFFWFIIYDARCNDLELKKKLRDRALYTLEAYSGKDFEEHKLPILKDTASCCLSADMPSQPVGPITEYDTNYFGSVYRSGPYLSNRYLLKSAGQPSGLDPIAAIKCLFYCVGKKINLKLT